MYSNCSWTILSGLAGFHWHLQGWQVQPPGTPCAFDLGFARDEGRWLQQVACGPAGELVQGVHQHEKQPGALQRICGAFPLNLTYQFVLFSNFQHNKPSQTIIWIFGQTRTLALPPMEKQWRCQSHVWSAWTLISLYFISNPSLQSSNFHCVSPRMSLQSLTLSHLAANQPRLVIPDDGLPSIDDWLGCLESMIFGGVNLGREPIDASMHLEDPQGPSAKLFSDESNIGS